VKNSLRTMTLAAACVAMFGQSGGRQRVPGYLDAKQTAAVARIVPAAPETGDARFEADIAIFHKTRAMEGSPRWALAQSDDSLSVAGLLHAFSCSVGMALTPENAPKLTNLINRANVDATAASNTLKNLYQHKRPFQIAEGNVCVSAQGKASLERSPDYPSGHTTLSWETALILAEARPEDAIALLARARAFGQSRVVCGVHNLSAVEAGWMTATAVYAMQSSSADFRKDLEAVRMELEELKKSLKEKPSGCEAEAQTLAKDPY
jgi:acid phosphatase (class A)